MDCTLQDQHSKLIFLTGRGLVLVGTRLQPLLLVGALITCIHLLHYFIHFTITVHLSITVLYSILFYILLYSNILMSPSNNGDMYGKKNFIAHDYFTVTVWQERPWTKETFTPNVDKDNDNITCVITYSQLLFNVFNCGLQSSGPLCGLILHCFHRLQEGCYIGHHHLPVRSCDDKLDWWQGKTAHRCILH